MPRQNRYPKELRQKRVFKRSLKFDPIPPRVKKRKFRNKKRKWFVKYSCTLRTERMVSPRVYKHYKLNRKDKRIKDYDVWEHMVYKFFRTFKKHLLENESGVFIKDFGYFFVMRHNRIAGKVKNQKVEGEGRKYSAVFAPIRKDTTLDTWSMDWGTMNSINTKIYQNVANGIRYRMAYTLLYNFYGNQNNQIYLVEKNVNNN